MPPDAAPRPGELRPGEEHASEPFETLFAFCSDGVLLTRPDDGAILRANPAAQRMLGRTEDELRAAGRAGLAVATPALEALLAERERTGVARGELLLRRRDGTTFPAEVTSAVVPASGGGSLATILLREPGETRRAPAAPRDGAEHLELAQRAVQESEQRFRTLADALPQIVCALAADGTPEYVNGRWTELSGLDLAQTAAVGWVGVIHPDDVPVAMDCWRRARETREVQEVELRYRTAAGGYRWFLSRLAPLVDARGEVVRFVGAAMDVDERRRAEGEREELLAAVQDVDRRKNEFLAILSHELRNPLAPIRNGVYLLGRAAPGSDQAVRALEVIDRQTRQLTRLVDDLLDVTRIARGKVELQRAPLDLRDVVRRTSEDHRGTFEASDLTLRYELPAGPIWIDADPARIAQVLGNLLQNASKFTPAGGHVLVVAAAEDDRAVLRVRDDGLGMERDAIHRMFQPFVQADRSLARTRGGLGLGLALVKGLVELHGGDVGAASEGPDRGSEFVVRLPLCARAEPRETPLPARGPAGGARSVLVVEDNVDAAQSLAEILELEGHRVHVARDGRSGIALAREVRPDVVLCDIGLPDVDGYEVARTLRGDPALRGVRLVALSGYALPEDRERAARAGFDAHVAKPPSFAAIAALLAADDA